MTSILVLFFTRGNLTHKVYAGFADSKEEIMKLDEDFDPFEVITKLEKIEANLKESEQALTDFGQSGSYFRHFEIVGGEISISQRVSEIAKNLRILSEDLKPFLTKKSFTDITLFDTQEQLKISLKLLHEINYDLLILEKSQFIGNELSDGFQVDLKKLENYLENFERLSDFMPEILGFNGTKRYLLILQNPREARATGGFIGNYGIISVENGEFEKPYIQDIYYLHFLKRRIYKEDLDYKAKDFPNSIMPSQVLIEGINWGDWWNIKDGNWVADFPFTAKKIEYSFDKIYHQGSVDGVIAFDPTVIIDILKVTGKIELPTENIFIDSKNFWDVIEYKVEIDNPFKTKQDLTANPKQIIVDFADILTVKLQNLTIKEYIEICQSLWKNFQNKHILTYFNNPRLQNLAKELDFTGHLKNYHQDYLYVNRSSRNAAKASQRIRDRINYSVVVNNTDGKAKADLTIKRKHLGSRTQLDSWEKTFWQIMIPTDTKSLTSEIDKKNDFIATKFYNYLGRRNFIGYSEIHSQEEQTLRLTYDLPFKIKTDMLGRGQYELLIQKQPGFDNDIYEINIQFPLNWQVDTNSEYQVENNTVIWKGKLRKDKKILVNFRK